MTAIFNQIAYLQNVFDNIRDGYSDDQSWRQKNARSARCGCDGTIAPIGVTAAASAACVLCVNAEDKTQVSDLVGVLLGIRFRSRSVALLSAAWHQRISYARSKVHAPPDRDRQIRRIVTAKSSAS